MAGGLHEDITLPFEQEYELYHNDLSLCSKKVRVCLAELGIDYKPHHIDLIETGSYETLSRHYLKVNPAGILPVLVHNGHPAHESHDIISYVADRADNHEIQLVPEDPERRALMQRWKDLASITGDNPTDDLENSAAACVAMLTVPLFASGIKVIPYHLILEGILFHRIRFRAFMFLALKLIGLKRLFRVKKINAMVDRAKAALSLHFEALEQLLDDRRHWIVGEQFTLADISWMVIFDRLQEAGWTNHFLGGNTFPLVQAYWQRLRERPSYTSGVDAFRHPLVTEATARIIACKNSDANFRAGMVAGCPTP
jgi:glutathione S-transferase